MTNFVSYILGDKARKVLPKDQESLDYERADREGMSPIGGEVGAAFLFFALWGHFTPITGRNCSLRP